MKLYIGNCTHQNQVIYYRVPENPSPRQQHIDIGGQVQISGELNVLQVEEIIKQLRPYGMVAVEEIDRTKPFIGLCYSVDRPVKVDFILRAHTHNADVLTERGKQFRQEAAVATNQAIENSLHGQAKLDALEITIDEEPHKDGSNADFSEGVRVTREAPDAPAPRKRAGGRR